jgi:uncharacterized membrane protein HdeD (DUF308 family)
MTNYKIFIDDTDLLRRFIKYSRIYGAVFMILGAVGMIFPALLSAGTAILMGWLLLIAGMLSGVQTWQFNRREWYGWLKTAIYLLTGFFIILNPLPGIIALGMLFALYFLIDGAAGIALALMAKPEPFWWIALINGVLSAVIGVYFFLAIADPLKMVWLVGIFVGINLFFNGVMLWSISRAAGRHS